MKEYKVLGKSARTGEWYRPLHHFACVKKTLEDALSLVEVARKIDNERTTPSFTEFKIMVREVSEWEDLG